MVEGEGRGECSPRLLREQGCCVNEEDVIGSMTNPNPMITSP